MKQTRRQDRPRHRRRQRHRPRHLHPVRAGGRERRRAGSRAGRRRHRRSRSGRAAARRWRSSRTPREESAIAAAIDAAVREFGALDVCYANAGISGGWVPLHEQTPEHWAEILKINLIGTFLAVKHAARVMTPRKRGSIICTASVAGLRSGAGGSPYSASKAGVVSLVQTTAYQLSGSGVRINAICPGLIETGMTRADLRAGTRPRHRSQDRSAQSAAPRRCAGRDRADGAVPRLRRRLIRQRPGLPGRRRPVELASDRAAEAVRPERELACGTDRVAGGV